MNMTMFRQFLFLFVPLVFFLWLGNLVHTWYNPESKQVSPWRLMFAALAPVYIALSGLEKKSLDKTGAAAGVVVGLVLTLGSFCFFTALLTFFVLASRATKFRAEQKKKLEEEFKEGGQRNWIQVICNGGVASLFAFLYIVDVGCKERPINFSTEYNASWYSVAVLGALACSCGDTFASEIGTVVRQSEDVTSIITFNKVPRGTNGGVTLVGTLSSMFGGFLVGIAYYISLLLLTSDHQLVQCPPQWLIVPVAAMLGLYGSTIDSVLGGLLQYSGYDKDRGCIVECPGPSVEHISGVKLLNNHSVNLLSSLLTALAAPKISMFVWWFFS